MDNSTDNEIKKLKLELLFLKSVLNNTHEAVLIVQDNQIVFHNKKLREFTGYSPLEVENLPASHLIYPADKELLEDGFRFIRTHKTESYVFTFRILDKKNEIRWMESKISSIEYEGQPAAIFYIYDISEFKQAEEAVNVSIDFLNTLIDTIPNPMFYKNTRGEFIGCNNAFVNFIGKSKEEIIGKTTFDIVPEKVANGFHQLNMKLINKTGYQVRETKIPHADGSLHDVISYHATFYLSDKSVGGIVGILTDISEQKLVEQQLRHTEFRYRQLVKNINVGIVVFNPRLNGTRFIFSEINLHAATILGETNDKLKGRGLSDFFIEDSEQELYQMVRQVWETGQSVEMQYKFSLSGQNKLIKHFIYKVPSGDIVTIFDDITAAETTQKVLRESEEKYRFLIENSSDVVLKINNNLEILFASPAFIDVFQIPLNQVLGKDLLQFVMTADREHVHDILERCLKNNQKGQSEHRVITKDGIKWFSWSLKAVELPNADKQLVAIGHDITAQKLIEAELRKAKVKAEESDQLKSAFVANMSHEIRTPLNAIIGSSEILVSNGIAEKERKEYLKYIINNGKSLLNLINEIIDSAKIEAGKISIQIEKFQLQDLIDDVHGVFRSYQSLNPEVEIRTKNISAQPLQFIYSDSHRIKQILNNLINNALKFTDKGHIEIGYQIDWIDGDKSMLKLYVQDTGIGIPQEKHQHIFQRFGQVEQHQRRNSKGTGLGLSISKHLAELMGGTLTLTSEVGQGTTFYLDVPVRVEQTSEPVKVVSSAKVVYNWSEKTVLIAEDNKVNYLIMKKMLSRTGISIIWAKNGSEAIQLFRETNCDIILMDMQMPVVDGFEATTKIKEMSNIPVIAQTASALYEDREKIIAAGCDDFIAKPINFPVLFQKMNLIFER